MHEFGVSIIWLSLQVTIVAIATAILYRLTLSRGPILRSLVVSSSMLVMLVLAGFAFSPWPRWSREVVIVTQVNTVTTIPVIAETIEKNNPATTKLPQAVAASEELESVWAAAWQGFQKGLEKPQPVTNTQVNQPLTWPAILGWLFVVGVSLGMLRLCLGFFLLWRETRLSSSLKQTAAQELLDELLAVQPCRLTIRLRESQRLSTAAVVGCWRPVILLPSAWKTWSTDQLRAVLTHELAHINQGDFLSNFCAEISRSVHFYHPLMHWLAARLRLEQELAADAAAAKLSGGAEPYLIILAELAMAQSHRPIHWPARAFLPTHSTFLRRIEVLKNKTPLTKTITRTTRAVTLAAVMLAGLTAIGFRSESNTIAEDTKQVTAPVSAKAEKTESTREKFRIDFVPDNACAVVAIRPAEILAQESMKPLLSIFETDQWYMNGMTGFKEIYGVDLKDVDTATVMVLAPEKAPRSWDSIAIVIQSRISDKNWVSKMRTGKLSEIKYKGKTYLKNASVPALPHLLMFDGDRTVIFTSDEKNMRDIIDAMQRDGAAPRTKLWKSIENESVAAVIDMPAIRQILGGDGAKFKFGDTQIPGLITPIWEYTETVSLGMTINQDLSLEATLSQEKQSKKVKKTLDAILTLSSNMLALHEKTERTSADKVKDPKTKEAMMVTSKLMGFAKKMLDSTEVTQKDEDVTLTASLAAEPVIQLVALLVPAIKQAREAARRVQARNNLKRIGLALHNYHHVHGHFPPAVVMGPDGKTPHSWRVALLPTLGQDALYNQYRLNEPWDSEHNMKLAKVVIPVYHNPNDDKPANSSYFAIVGKNTVFGSKDGIKLSDVTDGTSNVIAFVEAKRDIPWTKPEDIKYDGEKIPKFGGFHHGGYQVVLCDGAVKFISEKIDEKVLHKLLQINDGQPVP